MYVQCFFIAIHPKAKAVMEPPHMEAVKTPQSHQPPQRALASNLKGLYDSILAFNKLILNELNLVNLDLTLSITTKKLPSDNWNISKKCLFYVYLQCVGFLIMKISEYC